MPTAVLPLSLVVPQPLHHPLRDVDGLLEVRDQGRVQLGLPGAHNLVVGRESGQLLGFVGCGRHDRRGTGTAQAMAEQEGSAQLREERAWDKFKNIYLLNSPSCSAQKREEKKCLLSGPNVRGQ